MTVHSPTAMPRSIVYYTLGSTSHRMRLHWAPGTDSALAATNAAAVCNQLKTLVRTAVSFSAHDYIPAGSNVANPTTWTAIAGTNGTVSAADLGANVLSFVGRTAGGCRARLFLFCDWLRPDANYRLTTAENSLVSTIIAWMNTTSNPLVALDGLAPVWKPYVNVAPHDYWVKRLRRG